MIAFADQKAGLAWLDLIATAVNGNDPHMLLGLVAGASEFYAELAPESPDEFLAIRLALDAIAAAEYRALDLLTRGHDAGR